MKGYIALTLALLTIAAPAAADETPSTTAPPAQAKPAVDAEPALVLHVESEEAVAIEREDTGELVCTSPCDKPVPATARYRVGGGRPSQVFVLDGRNGGAKILVDPATKRGFYTGVGVLAGGAAVLIGGIVALAVGYANQSEVPGTDGTVTDTSYTDAMTVGTVLVVTGLTAGIYGGATLAANLKSSVRGNIVKDPPVSGSAKPNRSAEALRTTPAFFFPLLRGTF